MKKVLLITIDADSSYIPESDMNAHLNGVVEAIKHTTQNIVTNEEHCKVQVSEDTQEDINLTVDIRSLDP